MLTPATAYPEKPAENLRNNPAHSIEYNGIAHQCGDLPMFTTTSGGRYPKDLTMHKNNRRSVWTLILLAAVWAAPSFAQSVFRCTVNGKVVLSDQPCADSTALRGSTANLPSAPTAAAPPAMQNTSNYSTPYGEWRGQAQYQATDRGQLLPGAHAVVNMAIAIDAAGKVVGSSPDNGCKLLGVAAPFVSPTSLSLDVTLSGCQFASYNRRYSGYLILNPAQKTAALTLNGAIALVGSFTIYDLRGTMRR